MRSSGVTFYVGGLWGASDGGWMGEARCVLWGREVYILTSTCKLHRRYRFVRWKMGEPVVARHHGRLLAAADALAELVAAHDAPPWGGEDDPSYEKVIAIGRRLDAAWERARATLGGET